MSSWEGVIGGGSKTTSSWEPLIYLMRNLFFPTGLFWVLLVLFTYIWEGGKVLISGQYERKSLSVTLLSEAEVSDQVRCWQEHLVRQGSRLWIVCSEARVQWGVHTHASFISSMLYEWRFSQDDSGTLVRYLSR